MPPLVLGLYLGNLALVFLFVANHLLGEPSRQLTLWLDLDGEQNVPTWYTSMQWFLAAALLALFAERLPARRRFAFAVLPLAFLAMSLDEVIGVHEWLGVKSDTLLAAGDRQASLFSANGIWVLVIGLPFVALLGVLLYSLRECFRAAPGALWTIAAGLAIAAVGALGFEMLLNFVPRYGTEEAILELLEETLEMVGATTVVWGAYALATSPAADTPPAAPDM